jgi:hypothetical protein
VGDLELKILLMRFVKTEEVEDPLLSEPSQQNQATLPQVQKK